MKRQLKETLFAKQDLWIDLLNYKMEPLEYGKSPYELLMGRKLKGRVPDCAECQVPDVKKHTQASWSQYPLPPLNESDQVRILKKNNGWATKAWVEKPVAPRSYQVHTEDGSHLRRNRQHLLKIHEDFSANVRQPMITGKITQQQSRRTFGALRNLVSNKMDGDRTMATLKHHQNQCRLPDGPHISHRRPTRRQGLPRNRSLQQDPQAQRSRTTSPPLTKRLVFA